MTVSYPRKSSARTRKRRDTDRSPKAAKDEDRECPQCLRPRSQRSVAALCRTTVGESGARVPEHSYRLRRELGLLARVVPPELERLPLVVPHLLALVDTHELSSLVVLPVGVLRTRRLPSERDIVEPFAVRQGVVRVQIVRLPESTRIGRQRGAADHNRVPHHPRRDREHRGCENDERPFAHPLAATADSRPTTQWEGEQT